MNNKNQKVTLYIDSKGEVIDYLDLPVKSQQECDNTIKFCCIATVPDGFIIPSLINIAVCFDFSQLDCCIETRDTTCEVPNPCNGTLTCPVEIQAVRLVGCARMSAKGGELKPISGFSLNSCTVSCETTTCVDQIIGFTCGKIPPCKPCYEVLGGTVSFILTTDDCGRQILVVQAELPINFIGCDC